MDFLEILSLENKNNGVSTGNNWLASNGNSLSSHSPVDGSLLGSVTSSDKASYEEVITAAQDAFLSWRMMPASACADIVMQIGDASREYNEHLGKLVAYE